MTEKRNAARYTAGHSRGVGAYEIGGVKDEVTRLRTAQTTSVNAVWTGTKGSDLPRILEYSDRPDNVSAIQEVVRFAGIVVGKDGERISRLKAGDGSYRPTPGHFAEKRISVRS